MSKKIITIVAGTLAVALAFAFLGGMAIKIAAIPSLIIMFGVLAMIGWDFIDTMRTSIRTANNGNGNGNGGDTTGG